MNRLTRKQVAQRFGISVRTLDRLRQAGLIPWVDLSAGHGGKPIVRFREEDVAAYEQQHLMNRHMRAMA